MPDFLHLELLDVLDILLVGFLIYQIYKIIKGTNAVSIFIGILSLYFVWLLVKALHMELLTTILDTVINLGVLALLIVFQPEIRRFLLGLGSQYKLLRPRGGRYNSQLLDELTSACSRMMAGRTGALIAIEVNASLNYVAETGDTIDAAINRRLIENIFFKNSPLHDGGLILSKGRLLAARCTFPMSERQDIPPQYGMRHRAAVGLSEQSDAIVIIVSEETGNLSIAHNGELTPLTGIAQLRLAIETALSAS